MAIFSGPKIPNTGLVLNLDSANLRSYPGSGTAWANAGQSNISATLLNSPTYVDRSFSLSGTNNYIRIASNNAWKLTGSNTFNCWVKPNSSTGLILCYQKGGWQGYQLTPTSIVYSGIDGGNDSSVSWSYSSLWQMLTWVIDRSLNKYIVYRNGDQLGMSNITHPALTTTSNLYIGSRGDVPDNFWNGIISMLSFYDRALGQTEIQQNFEATRGRYGI